MGLRSFAGELLQLGARHMLAGKQDSLEQLEPERLTAARGVPRPGYGQFWTGFAPSDRDEEIRRHEAFDISPSIHRAVEIRKDTLAKLPLRFYRDRGDKKIEILRQPGNIVDLWQKANAEESSWNVVEQLQASLDLVGNAYMFLETDGAGDVTSISTLPAHLTWPIVKAGGREIDYYRLVWFGKIYKLPVDQVVHIKAYAHGLSILGLNPIRAAWTAFRTNKYGGGFNPEVVTRGGAFSAGITPAATRGNCHGPIKRRRPRLPRTKCDPMPLE